MADHVFAFFDPAGRIVPESRPAAPATGPSLARCNTVAGLTITPETGRSLGEGASYDLDLTIEALLTAPNRLSSASPATGGRLP